MKHTSRFLVIPALLLALSAPVVAETIEVRADAWPPYNIQPGTPSPGYVVELLALVFPQGAISYKISPWPRAVKDVTEGKIHAIIGAAKDEAPGTIYPEEPAGATTMTFYVAKDNTWRFTDLDSLKKAKVGAVSGYAYDSGPVDAYLAAGTVPAVQLVGGEDTLQTNIKKLQAGRITTILEDANVMSWTLKELGLPADTFISAGQAAAELSFIYVVFSPTHPESAARAARWTEVIRQLRADGTLAKILAKYNVQDWKK